MQDSTVNPDSSKKGRLGLNWMKIMTGNQKALKL
jgi:hypothetical protein